MQAFYKVSVTKQPIGSAIMHKEPPLEGEIVIKVTDASTAGDFKLVVLECTPEQHEANLTLPGVAAISEAEAAKLAAKYQPKRTLTELDPRTGKEEKLTIPAADLRTFLEPAAAQAPKPMVRRGRPAS